jgi:hypothetical protein
MVGFTGCQLNDQVYYQVEDQIKLAHSRTKEMENKITFSISVEREKLRQGEKITFLANITNVSDKSIIIRKPRQSNVLEIIHPNAVLLFSVSPTHDKKLFWFPNEYFGYDLAVSPVEPDEFVELIPNQLFQVRLEIPIDVLSNINGETNHLELPAGEYILNMKYLNQYIGYSMEKIGDILYVDLNAWVGDVEANPVSFTVLP